MDSSLTKVYVHSMTELKQPTGVVFGNVGCDFLKFLYQALVAYSFRLHHLLRSNITVQDLTFSSKTNVNYGKTYFKVLCYNPYPQLFFFCGRHSKFTFYSVSSKTELEFVPFYGHFISASIVHDVIDKDQVSSTEMPKSHSEEMWQLHFHQMSLYFYSFSILTGHFQYLEICGNFVQNNIDVYDGLGNKCPSLTNGTKILSEMCLNTNTFQAVVEYYSTGSHNFLFQFQLFKLGFSEISQLTCSC